jgi:hypothetical protein
MPQLGNQYPIGTMLLRTGNTLAIVADMLTNRFATTTTTEGAIFSITEMIMKRLPVGRME